MDLHRAVRWLEDAFPGLRAAAAPIRADSVSRLLPEERQQVARAVPGRVAEYATGRRLARHLLPAELSDTPLLNGPDRAPQWPRSARGSITHTDTHCVVVVFPVTWSVGVDLEQAAPLPPGLRSMILQPDELNKPTTPATLECWDRIAFSTKEAYYKAIYAQIRRFVDFHEAHLQLFQNGSAHIQLRTDPSLPGEGRYTRLDEQILTLVRVWS